MTLNYQLGMYVGEYIIATRLPTLDTDLLKTNTIIKVSDEERAAYDKMEDDISLIRSDKSKFDEYQRLFYENLKWYHKLEEKYLPETIRLQVPRVAPTNLDEFTKGLETALWSSDLSHYVVTGDYFEETESYAWCSYVTLTRHIGKIPEKFV